MRRVQQVVDHFVSFDYSEMPFRSFIGLKPFCHERLPFHSAGTLEPYALQAGYDRPSQDGRGSMSTRTLRIPVATIVALVGEGQTTQEILALYPDLEGKDVREALEFAAEAVRERAIPLVDDTRED